MPNASVPPTPQASENEPESNNNLLSALGIFACVYALLIAVGSIGDGFKWLSGGAEGARAIFGYADNPVLGLMSGMLATALIQSSSTVTSVIVGLVAGGLPVSIAIPMVMGANMGTTVTNTIVSLGHIRRGEEFRRAFAAATIHDFFNIFAVAIFLPLEMTFGLLEKLSSTISVFFVGVGGKQDLIFFNPVNWATDPVVEALGKDGLAGLFGGFGPVLMIVGGIGLIFLSILFIGRLLKRVLIGTAKKVFHSAIGRGPLAGIASGTIVTFLVQSSTTTTSLAVPLAGAGALRLNQIYPFTLGANIGTCMTALLAAFAVDQSTLGVALQIALAHLLFNTLSVAIIYGIPPLRKLPLWAAETLSLLAQKRKIYAIAYLVLLFFAIPSLVWFLSP